MPDFKYKARYADMKRRSGVIDARDKEDAVLKLAEQQLFVTDITEIEEKQARYKMKAKELSVFCKELGIMLRSGLPLVKCLQIISNNETGKVKLKKVTQSLHRAIRGGKTMSEAMAEHGGFPELIINMFYSGELSGTIAGVAEKMSDYYMSEYKLKKKISSATMYPRILGFLTVGVIVILFAFVVPSITGMVEGQELPAITKFMMGISDLVIQRWYYLALIGVGIMAIVVYVKEIKSVRYRWDKLLLKMPKIGPLLRAIYTARFARTLSSLYGSGIQLVTAISVASKIIGNSYVEGQFPEMVRKVKAGELLSAAIAGADGFNDKLKSTIVIGEETGKLDEILEHTSASFEYDADVAIDGLLGMLLPVLLIIMAVVIAAVIISVLMPIFDLYNTLGGM
jgi:type IV pilus assembly protein PilC